MATTYCIQRLIRGTDAVEEAFSAATSVLDLSGGRLLAKNEVGFSKLDHSLGKLEQLKPLAKPQLLKACAASVLRDQRISAAEGELLRAFSDVLGCPIPTLIDSCYIKVVVF